MDQGSGFKVRGARNHQPQTDADLHRQDKRRRSLEYGGGISMNMSKLIFPEAPSLHLQCCRTGAAYAVPSAPWKNFMIPPEITIHGDFRGRFDYVDFPGFVEFVRSVRSVGSVQLNTPQLNGRASSQIQRGKVGRPGIKH